MNIMSPHECFNREGACLFTCDRHSEGGDHSLAFARRQIIALQLVAFAVGRINAARATRHCRAFVTYAYRCAVRVIEASPHAHITILTARHERVTAVVGSRANVRVALAMGVAC